MTGSIVRRMQLTLDVVYWYVAFFHVYCLVHFTDTYTLGKDGSDFSTVKYLSKNRPSQPAPTQDPNRDGQRVKARRPLPTAGCTVQYIQYIEEKEKAHANGSRIKTFHRVCHVIHAIYNVFTDPPSKIEFSSSLLSYPTMATHAVATHVK